MNDNKEKKGSSIFRAGALNRISSPEELDRYLVVTGPGVWLTLVAVIVLLAGFFGWMIFGRLDTEVSAAVVSQNGEVLCLVPEAEAERFLRCGTVTVAGTDYPLSDIGRARQMISSETPLEVRIAGGLTEGMLVVPLSVTASLPDGIYEGTAVVESVNPITFIIN